ncbi:hypothetical protein DSO57_1011138 [Entomophthora muscae]|uniref:Uncharacterized protein n=1 Tax=Entomophthora muscae TaxID=34485 RepID=A0ACC2U443_9FUNG|nr:hypothetical protein DSO57_1011138 [Entomophthora muscae]
MKFVSFSLFVLNLVHAAPDGPPATPEVYASQPHNELPSKVTNDLVFHEEDIPFDKFNQL